MAAFGILAALRERDGSARARSGVAGSGLGRGPDRRRLDGRRRAVVAGDGRRDATSPTAACRAAASCRWPARWSATGPTSAPTAGSRWARWSRSSGRRWCRGVGREDLIDEAVRAARARTPTRRSQEIFKGAHARAVGGVRARARLLPGAGARARRGARLRARARARDGRRARPARRRAPGAPARRARQARRARPASTRGCPGPALGEHTEEVLRGGRLLRRARSPSCSPAARRRGRRGRRQHGARCGRERRRRRDERAASATGDCRSSRGAAEDERAGRALGRERRARSATTCARGCSATASDIVRTSRNMAYYPPDYVERIALIKRLQEERFMPLRVIQRRAAGGPRARARADRARGPHPRARARERRGPRPRLAPRRSRERYDVPRNVLDRLAEIGVLTPNAARLRRRRREDHRGDRALPRRRLRGGARLHGLRHAALPRARSSRSCRRRCARCSTASPARSRSSARWRSSPRAPSRCAS